MLMRLVMVKKVAGNNSNHPITNDSAQHRPIARAMSGACVVPSSQWQYRRGISGGTFKAMPGNQIASKEIHQRRCLPK